MPEKDGAMEKTEQEQGTRLVDLGLIFIFTGMIIGKLLSADLQFSYLQNGDNLYLASLL